MREIKIYLAKIAWSVNKWQGLPDKKEDYERNINMAKDFEYVLENGLAGEWWNFYERIDPKYYYWTTPKGKVSKLEDGGIVFFISKKGEEKMYFVGVMGNCSKTDYEVSLNQLLMEDQTNWLKNKIDITTQTINFKAKGEKNLSFVLNEYIQINQEEYFGVTLKQAEFTEIKEEYNNKLIELLEKAKGEKGNEGLRGKIDKIINILKNKETGMKEVKEYKMSKWLEKIEEYITPELILKENYEEAIKKSERVAFLPVRPDWNEPKKMWGYYNPLTGLFYPTDGLIVLLNAFKDLVKNRDKERKYFIILDEMNLARVEYYMSDLLSLMENMWKADSLKGETAQIHPYLDSCILSKPKGLKDEQSGAYICSENKNKGNCTKCPYYPLLHPDEVKEGWEAEFEVPEGNPIPPRIAYPENLVIIGTVNVDETTFSFAPKVLDRAFVVEFNEVYVKEYLKEYSDLSDLKEDSDLNKNPFYKFVSDIIKILTPASLHFGYRVIHEMLEYLLTNKLVEKDKKFKLKDLEESNKLPDAFDFLLKSKVLPKIHGTEERVGKVLKKLMLYCEDPQKEAKDLNPDDLKDSEKWWEKYDEKKEKLKFKDSAAKICEMYARLKDTGYCSYF